MSQELQAKIQSLQTEFQDVSEQKLQMEKALSAKESALVDLETKVAEISLNSHAQIQSLQAELNDVSEQKLQVQKALSAKESALGDPETRVAEISEDLNAKIESLEADLNDMSQQKLQVEKELLVKESALGVLESRVEEVSQELLGWKEKADTFSREKCCAEEDATKLRTKIGDLEDGLAVMTRERDTVKGRLEELEILYNASLTQAGAKATMEEELVASRAEVSALKSLLAEAESRYEDLFDVGEKHTVDLESRLNDAESEGKRLEEALAAASGRNRQLEEEISTTSNHVQELSNHVDSLQAQIDKMREVGAALLTAKTQLEEENDDLLDQMAVLKEAGLAADAVRTELEAQLKSCEGAVEEAKETANGLHQQLQRQQEVVREAEEEHKRQIAQISADIATTFSDKVTVVELERDDIQRRFEELETLYNTSLSRAGEQAQLEEALEASRVEVNTLKSLLAESEARYEGLFDAGEKHTIDLESRLNAPKVSGNILMKLSLPPWDGIVNLKRISQLRRTMCKSFRTMLIPCKPKSIR
ncbi:hypothetical protein BC829DRAFT_112649 [Chytridium lagenaria]|nr:hypothetical protein BC829DRAFT_112649 [Chytridium lagenaria]